MQAKKPVSKGALVLLVTQSDKSECVHVSAVTKDDNSFQQQSQTGHALVPWSDMQTRLRAPLAGTYSGSTTTMATTTTMTPAQLQLQHLHQAVTVLLLQQLLVQVGLKTHCF